MIRTSHLHRRSLRFVPLIGILRGLLFKTGLRFEVGEFCQHSFQLKYIIYSKLLNERVRVCASIMESTAATTQLIRNMSKFDATDFVAWQRILREKVNLIYPEISKILDD